MSQATSPQDVIDAVPAGDVLDPASPPPGTTPADIAAHMYSLFKPRFEAMVGRLGSKGKERVMLRLNEHPLEKNYKWGCMKEKETYLLGCQLQDAKFAMMMSVYFENLDVLAEKAQSGQEFTAADYVNPLDLKGNLKQTPGEANG